MSCGQKALAEEEEENSYRQSNEYYRKKIQKIENYVLVDKVRNIKKALDYLDNNLRLNKNERYKLDEIIEDFNILF